jgi:hypothetical protein
MLRWISRQSSTATVPGRFGAHTIYQDFLLYVRAMDDVWHVRADRSVWRNQVLNKLIEVNMPHPAVSRTLYNKPAQGAVVDFLTVHICLPAIPACRKLVIPKLAFPLVCLMMTCK